MLSADLWRGVYANDVAPGRLVIAKAGWALQAGEMEFHGATLRRFVMLSGDRLGEAIQLGNERVLEFAGQLRFGLTREQAKLASTISAVATNREGIGGGLVLSRNGAFAVGYASFNDGGSHSGVSAGSQFLASDDEAFAGAMFAPRWTVLGIDASIAGATREEALLEVGVPTFHRPGHPLSGRW